jgi:hypothetical protein
MAHVLAVCDCMFNISAANHHSITLRTMPWCKGPAKHGYYCHCFCYLLLSPWPLPVLQKSGIACSASASTPAWLLGIKWKGAQIVIRIDRKNCHAISCEEKLAISPDEGVLGWVCVWRENNEASNMSGKVSNKRAGDSCSGPWAWDLLKIWHVLADIPGKETVLTQTKSGPWPGGHLLLREDCFSRISSFLSLEIGVRVTIEALTPVQVFLFSRLVVEVLWRDDPPSEESYCLF